VEAYSMIMNKDLWLATGEPQPKDTAPIDSSS
jgi:hypothetical protein